MKKVVLIAVFVAASGFVFAQSVHFGLKAGVNLATQKQSGVDFNSRTSLHAGGLAHIHVSKHFAVQPELFYSGEGAEYSINKIKLGYLDLPVLLQFMAGNGFRLQTGPQVGFLLSALSVTNGIKSNVKHSYNSAVFSWVVGASYQFPNSGTGIDARYNIGISDVAGSPTEHIKGRVFAVGLFYQFKH